LISSAAVVDQHAKDDDEEADEVKPSKLLPLDSHREGPDDNNGDRIEDFSRKKLFDI